MLAVLALGGRRQGRPAVVPWRWWFSPLLWLALAVAWTWPAIVAGEHMVGRHFDTQGTIWAISAAPRLLTGLTDALTGWPGGADYTRLDSFVLVGVGWLLSALDPVRLHGWMQVLGVAASAWAAEKLAEGVGAAAPWSLAAGVLFAFSGLAATALLEGHVYHLLDPWLPLMTLCWWRALSPSGRWWHGAGTAALFTGALLSTGYLGLCAAAVLVGLLVGALLRPRRPALAPILTAALCAVPVILTYVALFQSSPGSPAEEWEGLRQGAAHLTVLGPPTPELDRSGHALALAVSPVMLGLVALSGVLLPRRQRWRALLWTGAVGFLLVLGPTAGIGPWRSGASLPEWAEATLSMVRFPARLSWIWLVCWSALSARVLTALAGRSGSAAAAVLLLLCVDTVLTVRLPVRQVSRIAVVPAVYSASTGPVLDLFPEEVIPGSGVDIQLTATACAYQAVHGRAIAEDCVATGDGLRVARSREILAAMLAGEGRVAQQRAAALGVETVVLHGDLFSAPDRARLSAVLGGTLHVEGGEALTVASVAAPWPPVVAPVVTLHTLSVAVLGGTPGASHRLVLGEDTVVLHGREPAVGQWQGDLSGPIRASLWADGAEVWSGRFRPAAAEDRLTLRVTEGEVMRVAAAPTTATATATRSLSERIVRLGGLLIGVILLVGRLRLRR
ncbi:MAG: hypothetical protein ACI8RZ_006609 [Myxococcota bacterium]